MPINPEALKNEAAVIFMAGHETTANTLSWVWYILSQDAFARARLHHEIDTVLEGRVPTLEDVQKLCFTRAVIEETLRLYPPVPILSRRVNQDICYQDKEIKKESIFLVVPWLLHRHKKYWSDPDCFIPDRFLSTSEKPNKHLYIPFSVGPRVCAGISFGLTEAILVLAVFVQTFDFSLNENEKIEAVSHLSLRPNNIHGKLPMIIKKRDIVKQSIGEESVITKKCPYLSEANSLIGA